MVTDITHTILRLSLRGVFGSLANSWVILKAASSSSFFGSTRVASSPAPQKEKRKRSMSVAPQYCGLDISFLMGSTMLPGLRGVS